ncbi:MAG: phenylacetic acid degradation protein PaaN [Propionibacteriales bacterium]|nr:phenylacetic acid degradation protein PaaN [Propionibacteriales bacterium]
MINIDEAVEAIRARDHYSAFAESPSPRVYGEGAAEVGRAAFDALLGTDFAVSTPGAGDRVSPEVSPYGLTLAVAYPRVAADAIDELITGAVAGTHRWRDAGPRHRAEVCVAILEALHARVFELAHAVMHTSGQAFVMAFQAGGTHALDRALEAIAYALAAQEFHPATATWTKPGRKQDLVVEKAFTPVGRGLSLLIGCNTFPTWNSYPGLFASLATGNPVIVKPHPNAVLPLAITVQVCQQVLAENGFDPHLVTLAVERPGDGLAKDLAVHDAVKLIDYTGGNEFGDWLVDNARQAVVFAEQAGVNAVVIDSTDDVDGMINNLAFSLALYSGQMCTTSQNLFIPADGIDTDQGRFSPSDVGLALGRAIDELLGPDEKAVELLGAIVNTQIPTLTERARSYGEVLVESRGLTPPAFDQAVIRTPSLILVDEDSTAYEQECFGPVTFVVSTSSTQTSIHQFIATVTKRGAMTAAIHSTSDEVLAAMREAALDVGVALSENLTGGVYVNQSAAFSDFHGTGANPAANAAYTDLAYVANRFHVVQSRR